MGDGRRPVLVKINETTSCNLTSSFSSPEPESTTIFEVLKKYDKILVKQSHAVDIARKRSRYDIFDNNGFPILTGFQNSRRFSLLPDPVTVYNTDLQLPLLQIKFQFVVARYKNAEVYAGNDVFIGSVKRNIDMNNGFLLYNQRDGYLFNAQWIAPDSPVDVKFIICTNNDNVEVAKINGKSQVDYALKFNDHSENTPNTKSLLLGFLLYYDTMRR